MWKGLLIALMLSGPAHASLVTFQFDGILGCTNVCHDFPPDDGFSAPYQALFSLDPDIAYGYSSTTGYEITETLELTVAGRRFIWNDYHLKLVNLFDDTQAIIIDGPILIGVASSVRLLSELTLPALASTPLTGFNRPILEQHVRPPGTDWELGGHTKSVLTVDEPDYSSLWGIGCVALLFGALVPRRAA